MTRDNASYCNSLHTGQLHRQVAQDGLGYA